MGNSIDNSVEESNVRFPLIDYELLYDNSLENPTLSGEAGGKSSIRMSAGKYQWASGNFLRSAQTWMGPLPGGDGDNTTELANSSSQELVLENNEIQGGIIYLNHGLTDSVARNNVLTSNAYFELIQNRDSIGNPAIDATYPSSRIVDNVDIVHNTRVATSSGGNPFLLANLDTGWDNVIRYDNLTLANNLQVGAASYNVRLYVGDQARFDLIDNNVWTTSAAASPFTVNGVSKTLTDWNNGTTGDDISLAAANSSSYVDANFRPTSTAANVGDLLNSARSDYYGIPMPSSSTTAGAVQTTMVIAGTSGSDTFTLKRNGADLHVWVNVSTAGDPTYEIDYATAPAISIAAGAGDDTLVADYSAGDIVPVGGLTFDGQTHSNRDVVKILGTASNDSVTDSAANDVRLGTGSYITFSNAERVWVEADSGADTINLDDKSVAVSIVGGSGNDTLTGEFSGQQTNYFYVIAKTANGVGNSAPSPAASVITPAFPDKPASLIAAPVTQSSVTLAWVDSSSNENGFRVERSINGTTWTEVGRTAADDNAFIDAGVTDGSTYWYRVAAMSPEGESAFATINNVKTPLDTPVGVVVKAARGNSVDLAWVDRPTGETGFRIELSEDGGSTWSQVATAAAGAQSATIVREIGGFAPSTTYQFRVIAFRSTDVSEPSVPASVTTAAYPNAPANLTGTALSQKKVELGWDAVAGASATAFTVRPPNSRGL